MSGRPVGCQHEVRPHARLGEDHEGDVGVRRGAQGRRTRAAGGCSPAAREATQRAERAAAGPIELEVKPRPEVARRLEEELGRTATGPRSTRGGSSRSAAAAPPLETTRARHRRERCTPGSSPVARSASRRGRRRAARLAPARGGARCRRARGRGRACPGCDRTGTRRPRRRVRTRSPATASAPPTRTTGSGAGSCFSGRVEQLVSEVRASGAPARAGREAAEAKRQREVHEVIGVQEVVAGRVQLELREHRRLDPELQAVPARAPPIRKNPNPSAIPDQSDAERPGAGRELAAQVGRERADSPSGPR